MYKIIIVCLILIIHGVISANFEEKIQQYFKSDVFKSYQKHWQAHRRSYQNAIASALRENYGLRGMNVLVRRSADMMKISSGFYVSDNVVDVLFLGLTLSSLPLLESPEVTFALASNVLRIESSLSKIIIEGNYILFRNQSDIVFDAGSNMYKHSPFSHQQVEETGRLAIVADECSLLGYALVKLSGQTVNLGHQTFQVDNCKFSVEISSPRFGTPPVIAPYFSSKQAKAFQVMLSRPIIEEILPKLQATIFTILNTSVIFDSYLPKFRKYQDNIFKETVDHVAGIVKNININTVESNKVTVKLPQVSKYCSVICQESTCWNYVVVDNVTVHGLDTLYSSHMGGPFKLQSPSVSETLRFHSLMVRGVMHYENNTIQAEHDFVAEIRDMTVNFEIDLENSEATFKVLLWRSIAFSIIELEHYLRDRRAAGSFIHGYLSNVLPGVLEDHLSRMYNRKRPQQKLKLTSDVHDIECITKA